jgi:serine phosphatase RsbU (regulator of sigma subunit)
MSSDPGAHLRHELRTPLNHIIGYSELLLEEADDVKSAGVEAGLERIHADARQLLAVLNDLLAPARFRQNAGQLVRLPAVMGPLNRLVGTGAQVRQQAHDAGGERLLPDIDRILFAIGNLHTLVRDAPAPATAAPPHPGALPAAPRARAEAAAASGTRGCVLVVDDDENNRDMLSRQVAREGYQVQLASGGREALRLLDTERIDLVLLDVMMPEMDGYAVLQRMQSLAPRVHIPVIMISALDDMDTVIRCIELGAEDYLLKPFDAVLLRARMDACLEKKRLRDEVDRHVQRIERELGLARSIQLAMVPNDFPVPTDDYPVGVHATLQPAREIGGDLYDCFWIAPGRLCLVVADVADKGASAALYMVRTKVEIRLIATLLAESGRRVPTAGEIVTRVNAELCRDNVHAMFVTLFLCIVDARTGELDCCNAGHNPPFLVAADGTVTRLPNAGNVPAGIDPSFTGVSDEAQLAAGGSLFVYTDGVTEATNESGEFFGEERLRTAVQSCAGRTPQELVTRVLAAVREFAGAAAPSDDIALLACRWGGPAGSALVHPPHEPAVGIRT